MSKAVVLVVVSLAALVPFAGAQSETRSDTWLQVRTPYFVIASNATEKEARRAAHQFEGMRSVFQRVFPDAQLDTAAPMLVLAVQDKAALRALEPEAYLARDNSTLSASSSLRPKKTTV